MLGAYCANDVRNAILLLVSLLKVFFMKEQIFQSSMVCLTHA